MQRNGRSSCCGHTSGIESSSIHPLRLGFYTGDIFSPEPEVNRDAMPIYEVMAKVKPDVVSVAFDPEGSGPDTHYKALQAVTRPSGSMRRRIPARPSGCGDIATSGTATGSAKTNVMVPVSLNSLSTPYGIH